METSNAIALGALIISLIGLIPQFYQAFNKKGNVNKDTKSPKVKMLDSKVTEESESNNEKIKSEKEPMPYMLRILLLVIFAFATFLIEIIIFGAIAHYSGIAVNPDTMPHMWKLIYYALFLIPGVFLFLAFLTFVGNLKD